MNAHSLITHLTQRQDLSESAMRAMMDGILSGAWTPAQTAAALVALKMKGETPAEIATAAAAMRRYATPVPVSDPNSVVDTCGTGGDGGGTFNISTAAAFVAAACGVTIAKHGNRAISGNSGSSDVLESLGLPLTLSPTAVAALIRQTGIGFMFAPNHHAAMKHAAPVRRDLGIRTLFNLLGPLANPAGARRQVIGVFSPDLLIPYAETLAALGATRALIVHGAGLDEITIAGETHIAELQDGIVTQRVIAPEDAHLTRTADLTAIRADGVPQSRELLLSALNGTPGPARDIVTLNAAAALIVADKARDFPDGVQQAAAAIADGRARRKLDTFITTAQHLAPQHP